MADARTSLWGGSLAARLSQQIFHLLRNPALAVQHRVAPTRVRVGDDAPVGRGYCFFGEAVREEVSSKRQRLSSNLQPSTFTFHSPYPVQNKLHSCGLRSRIRLTGRYGLSKATVTRMESALAQAVNGDATAFASIVREHQAMVFSLAYHFLHDRPLAEDMAQEVFLHLFENLRSVQSAAQLKFWLRKAASDHPTSHERIPAKSWSADGM